MLATVGAFTWGELKIGPRLQVTVSLPSQARKSPARPDSWRTGIDVVPLASDTALNMARALLWVSFHSSLEMESATIPPPASI